MITKTLKIAKYLRISDEDFDLDGLDKSESDSIGNQRNLLNDFISKTPEFAGYEIIEELDDGRTGTNFSRSGVQRIIKMAEKGEIYCIIVKDFSRWGRSYIEVGDFLEQKFPSWGVRFISINDGYDSAKLNGGTAGIDIAFRNLVYELYSQDLSQKVRSGKDTAAKSGKISTTYPLYGYDKDKNDKRKLVIDSEDSLVVKRIFNLAEQGVKVAEIIRILNAQNVPTKQMSKHKKGYKTKWGVGDCWGEYAVKSLLRNECYTGKWIYGKTRVTQLGTTKTKFIPREQWIIVPGAIPAIITKEQFERVQRILDSAAKSRNPNNVNPHKSIFNNLVTCSECGRIMIYERRKHTLGVFKCVMKRRSDKFDCKTGMIRETELREVVFSALQQQVAIFNETRISKETHRKSALQKSEDIRCEIISIKNLIEQCNTSKMSLWEKFHLGEISREKFQDDGKRIKDQITVYQDKVVELETELEYLCSDSMQIEQLPKTLEEILLIGQFTKEVVDEFISKIVVYAPDKIEVVFNFRNSF